MQCRVLKVTHTFHPNRQLTVLMLIQVLKFRGFFDTEEAAHSEHIRR